MNSLDGVFETPVERDGARLVGPWRAPRQMLEEQSYGAQGSIHDDGTAQKLGFKGGTIEGPTHFSQFDPLCFALWGERWFQAGCISTHYRSPVFEGEEVRAIILNADEGSDFADITMEKRDGTQVLAGSVSIGENGPESALTQRLSTLPGLERPVVMRDVRVGMRSKRIPVRMDMSQRIGDLYPFSLAQKLERITEPSARYQSTLPLEMVSVLINHIAQVDPFPVRGPAIGLFADQEIHLLKGPLRVGVDYEVEREVVALSGSRRTESAWILSRVFLPREEEVVATMLLNTATLKASYAPYEDEFNALYGKASDA